MKFDTKPFTIEAIQFTGDNLLDVQEFCGVLADGNSFAFRRTKDQRKEWPKDAVVAKVWDYLHDTWVGVKLNQWIIRGMKGELYPCDDDVLKAKYQPSLSERTKGLQGNMDAQEWASVWMEYMKTKPHIAFDEGAMLCWFSNAIMAGFDEGQRQKSNHSQYHSISDQDESNWDEAEKEAYAYEDEYQAKNAKCHCGRPVAFRSAPGAYANLGPGPRHMCIGCLNVRCDVDPAACPYRGENDDLTPEQTGDGDSPIFAPTEASDGLLAVLKDENDKATKEASGGIVESIKKDTGIA